MISKTRSILGVIVAALTATALAPSAAMAAPSGTAGHTKLPVFGPGSSYQPVIHPADFTANVDNPLFPLKPGTTLVYSGTKDGKAAVDIFAATSQTAVIDGVTCRVVQDRLLLDGRLEERTADYYAQDQAGNVWYFGEDTGVLDTHGNVVDTSGSFHAGIDGAQPGVFMQAHPDLGRKFRQEWYQGQAEDVFHTTDLSGPITVPYGTFQDALRTEESTALEPGVLDNKYYVAGIGQVVEQSVKGPVEKLRLVDVIAP